LSFLVNVSDEQKTKASGISLSLIMFELGITFRAASVMLLSKVTFGNSLCASSLENEISLFEGFTFALNFPSSSSRMGS
jgi:hypothetical protein